MARLLDWRAALVYTHRWLGILGCGLFVMWFASGVVLMYARMPSLSAEERLARLPPLELSTARTEPADAARVLEGPVSSIRVSMLGDRPVYHLAAARTGATVYADTGELVVELDARRSDVLVRSMLPEHAGGIRLEATLADSDQWTLSSALRPLFPLYRYALGDAADTRVYLSARTGELVMKTTQRERLWGYLGAVLHWLYFTPLRRHTGLWSEIIIWSSLAGCAMCLSGLIWGVFRLSPRRRFRLRGQAAYSPYQGTMQWHHYAGLMFGLTTFTWIFSGLMSMTPWDWSPGNSPTLRQREAVAGGPLRLDHVTLERIRRAQDTFAAQFVPKELELGQFRGQPFAMAYRPPARGQDTAWLNTDLPAFLDPSTLARHFVWLSAPEEAAFTRFESDAVEHAARVALPGAQPVDMVWLEQYDRYYYDQSGARTLPVLRVRYDDADATWLYLDPTRGTAVQKEVKRTRLERWLYHGLHSLDFPGLYRQRPLWDLVVIGLSIGGTVLSVATLVPAWRRLRRHVKRRSIAWHDH